MSTNVQNASNTPKNSRRRAFLGAAGLVANLLTKVVDLPGLREPVRTAHDIAATLKAPNINDAKAQELIDRIDGVLAQIKPTVGGMDHQDLKKNHPGLHMAIEKIEGIKAELSDIKSKSRVAKFARQQDIEQSLSRKEHELHMAIQDVCRAMLTYHVSPSSA
ncbi:hypothetical protein RSOLAG22IIIB_13581 [Rhizoctonia solani]|uniref:Uncharacterized protein n=1 Tax=Rhizoctonia solani TaxID=456999 RepID=A0A0K6FP00_9AGAM|nr:hypothetical protein RSOLAG22IIIB_13581 [Rhizoctonia solani]